MKIETVDVSSGLKIARNQPYALITELSRVTYGLTPPELDHTEWVEAHFFGLIQEVRFLPRDSGLEVTVLTEEESDITIDYTADVRGATGFLARKYIEVDEDGQSYIAAVRLVAKEERI